MDKWLPPPHDYLPSTTKQLQATQEDSEITDYRLRCPYPYEIRGSILFIEGEEWGDAQQFFDEGEKIRSLVRALHEIAM